MLASVARNFSYLHSKAEKKTEPHLLLHQRSVEQQTWYNKHRIYKAIKDLFVLVKAGQCKGMIATGKIASEAKRMSSTFTKSAAAHARAIKELHWKKKPGTPISCEGLTAIYTPKLAALFEQAVVMQKSS